MLNLASSINNNLLLSTTIHDTCHHHPHVTTIPNSHCCSLPSLTTYNHGTQPTTEQPTVTWQHHIMSHNDHQHNPRRWRTPENKNKWPHCSQTMASTHERTQAMTSWGRSYQCPPNSCRNLVESGGIKFGRKACYFFSFWCLLFRQNLGIPELRLECSAEFAGTECNRIRLFVCLFVCLFHTCYQTNHQPNTVWHGLLSSPTTTTTSDVQGFANP